FQRSIAASMARTPQVIDGLRQLRRLSAESPGVAVTSPDATLTLAAVEPGDNPALSDWHRSRA
ncbi:MAG: carboxylesterase, partial [Pseudomonadota bacterium]